MHVCAHACVHACVLVCLRARVHVGRHVYTCRSKNNLQESVLCLCYGLSEQIQVIGLSRQVVLLAYAFCQPKAIRINMRKWNMGMLTVLCQLDTSWSYSKGGLSTEKMPP